MTRALMYTCEWCPGSVKVVEEDDVSGIWPDFIRMKCGQEHRKHWGKPKGNVYERMV